MLKQAGTTWEVNFLNVAIFFKSYRDIDTFFLGGHVGLLIGVSGYNIRDLLRFVWDKINHSSLMHAAIKPHCLQAKEIILGSNSAISPSLYRTCSLHTNHLHCRPFMSALTRRAASAVRAESVRRVLSTVITSFMVALILAELANCAVKYGSQPTILVTEIGNLKNTGNLQLQVRVAVKFVWQPKSEKTDRQFNVKPAPSSTLCGKQFVNSETVIDSLNDWETSFP